VSRVNGVGHGAARPWQAIAARRAMGDHFGWSRVGGVYRSELSHLSHRMGRFCIAMRRIRAGTQPPEAGTKTGDCRSALRRLHAYAEATPVGRPSAKITFRRHGQRKPRCCGVECRCSGGLGYAHTVG
jgi:hypothetical protein